MLRYIALLWDINCSSQTAIVTNLSASLRERPEWECVDDNPGMHAFCAGVRSSSPGVHPLPNRQGVVIGWVFDCLTGAPIRSEFRTSTGLAVISSRGRHLIEHFWGSYILFAQTEYPGIYCVLRSPMSTLPCFTASFNGVRICFSRMEDVALFRALKFTVSWNYLARELMFPGSRGRLTGIEQVTEILPGECIEVDTSRDRSTVLTYWAPELITREKPIKDFDTAVAAVRNTARMTAQAWYGQNPAVVQKLSGGFDSALVLASVEGQCGASPVICINDYSAGCDGDEREYARMASRRFGCELIEHARDPDLRFDSVRTACRTAFPQSYFLTLALGRPAVQLCRERGATALAEGDGGDEIFVRSPVSPAAADYVIDHGIDRGLFKVALGLAHAERTSIWDILRQGISQGFGKRKESYWTVYETQMSWNPGQSAVNMEAARQFCVGETALHPWFYSAGRVPPGKLWQILGLALRPYEDAFEEPDDPERLSPLLSQPLVELCLRIPTYVHTHQGWPRAVARSAFASEIPEPILNRLSKGGLDDYATEVLRRNFKFVSSILLEGELVRRGLLDRNVLELQLRESPSKAASWSSYLISEYLSLELWLNSWSSPTLSR